MGLLALPSYAAAQDIPRMPPSGYFNAVASNPKGSVDNITYGSNYVARVYTPPGYSTSRKYAAMYLMHGLGGSERSWHDNDLYAHIQLDNLIAQGAVEPFIIVFTKNDYANWSGFGNILINDLIPFVEGRYSICANPANRALGGLSMGGMQTINFGFPNADEFHYLMPSSSAPGIQGQSQLFPNGGALAKANLKLIFFTCGSGEVGSYGCNNNNTVKGYSESNGLGDIIEEFIFQGGGHNAATWRPSFWNYAQLAHREGFTNVAATCGMGGTGGMSGTGGMAGNAGTAGKGGTGTGAGGANGGRGGTGAGGVSAGGANGGSAGLAKGGTGAGGANTTTGGSSGLGGANGGSGTTGGSSALGGAINGAGGAATGAGGTNAQGGTPGMSGSGTTGGTPATGGVISTTGGQLPTAGSTSTGGAQPPGDDGGCGCSLPGSKPRTLSFALFAAAAAAALGRARTRRRRNLQG
jgi:enterochelin esterase-like enzyme